MMTMASSCAGLSSAGEMGLRTQGVGELCSQGQGERGLFVASHLNISREGGFLADP